jgi:hypothetical protein
MKRGLTVREPFFMSIKLIQTLAITDSAGQQVSPGPLTWIISLLSDIAQTDDTITETVFIELLKYMKVHRFRVIACVNCIAHQENETWSNARK